MHDLSGKRALVTGGSRGIGAAIVLELASRGADVAFSYERAADRAAIIVQQVKEMGRYAVAIQSDSADPAAAKRLVDESTAHLGGLDILVNNAGVARYGNIEDISIADIDALLQINIRGPILTSQAAIPYMQAGGRIVTIGSSLAERVPFGGITVYSLTKSALVAFTRGLARELEPRDITVNLVQPGSIDTDMNPGTGEAAEANQGFTALGRYGRPEELAAAVAFVASPAASLMTGSVMTVDAGFSA